MCVCVCVCVCVKKKYMFVHVCYPTFIKVRFTKVGSDLPLNKMSALM